MAGYSHKHYKSIRNAIIGKIARGECIECNIDLFKELGPGWRIPLCKKHRKEYMKEGGLEWLR